MTVIAPDILAEARQLSAGLSAALAAVGFLLWALGWRGHRFWIVLACTLTAGVLGLYAGPDYGAQPLAAGLLMAVAAGILALSLVRLVAFAAGGLAAWVLVHAAVPAWDQLLVCFLAGGLLGLLLFRLWTIALTSLAGSLLMTYAGLALMDRLGQWDTVGLAQEQGPLLSWLTGGLVLLGLAVQIGLERRRARKLKEKEEAAKAEAEYRRPRPLPRSRWAWIQGPARRAG